MDKVAAIVVTYNRKELLKQCIEKLQAQTVFIDILIVDNASTDGTSELFEEKIENVIYSNTGSNLGGAGGFSFGIKKAVELGYDYLWILDDDTLPTTTAVEALLKKDKELDGEYGFLSSKALWKDNSICTMNIQKQTKWKQVVNFDVEQTIQYASFVSLFMRATTVRKVGLPYKEFFIWTDDWEYTRRISKTQKCYYIPSSVVHHWCNSNVGANIITTEADRRDRFKYMYRNDVVMYRQDGFEGWLYLTIRNIIHGIRIIQKANDKNAKLSLISEATKEGKQFFPKIDFPERIGK